MTDHHALAVNAIRALAVDAVERANSGHPGAPMGLAPLALTLFTRHLKHNPTDPDWLDRDRFVLSAGHASMLLYATLHLTGYDVSIEDLQQFRQWGSRTPGHPELGETPGVETTTGPLGQGFGNAVGMALAERLLAARYNTGGHTPVDHRTWVIASDGDLMEGVTAEAASFAGHLGLDRLIVCWDDNRVTLDGPAAWTFSTEDVLTRFRGYGWRTLQVGDSEDLQELDRVLGEAAHGDGRPTLVRVATTIGFGAPTKANTSEAHGSPLGADEAAAAKAAWGWDQPPFTVPEDARRAADCTEVGGTAQKQWDQAFAAYAEEHPELAEEFQRVMRGDLPEDLDAHLPTFEVGDVLATRSASGAVLQVLAEHMPALIGGSADLAGSNKTRITNAGSVARGDFGGRNINWGVREHAMMAGMNGMAAHGGLRPFGGTFLTFSDYLRPSLRLAALMGLPVVLVATHDSIGLGEDGPTHQPVEHLAALRAMPNLVVIRPADAVETVGAWVEALSRVDGPTVLALSRQDVPVLEGSDAEAVGAGAYAIRDADDPDLVIIATGSEVQLALGAAEELTAEDIVTRVVSMPSWELFAESDEDEQADLLGDGEVPVLSVEAGVSFGWDRWSDEHVGVDTFGASAPAEVVFAEYGLTVEAVADAARDLLDDWEEE